MADRKLQIEITAKDGAKQVFQQLSSESAKLGTALEQSSAKANSAFSALQKHAAALSSLLGTSLARGLEEIAHAGEQNAQAQRQLQQAVENTGASWEEYAAAMEQAAASAARFGISDDKATNALQALTDVTGNAGKALDLLQTAEDLAAAKHMDLVTAAQLVGKAFDGNTQMLARYGIVLQQGATGAEAVAEIQARFAGQAEANTTILAHYAAVIEDWAGAAGQAMGPFAGLITLLPGISTGMQLLATAGGVVVDMFRAQQAAAEEAAVALEAESAASAAASVAGEGAVAAEGGLLAALTGPAGLVIALGAAAAGIGYLIARHHEQADALKTVTINVDELRSAYASLSRSSVGVTNLGQLFGVTQNVGSLQDQFNKQIDAIKAAQQGLKDLQDAKAREINAYYDPVTGQTNAQLNESIAIQQGLIASMEKQQGTAENLTKSVGEVQFIYAHLTDSGVDATRVTNELNTAFIRYNQSLADGHPNFVQLETDIAKIKAGMYANTQAATDATDAWTKLTGATTGAWKGVMDPLANADAQIKHIGSSMDSAALGAQKTVNDALALFHETIAHGNPDQIAAAYTTLGAAIAAADREVTSSENLHSFLSSLGDLVHPVTDSSQQISDAVANIMKATGTVAEQQKTVVSRALDELNAELAMDSGDADAAAASWAKFWTTVTGAQAAVNAASAGKSARDRAYNEMNTASINNGEAGSAYFAAQTAAAQAADEAIRKYISDLGMTPSFADLIGATGNQAAAAAAGVTQVTTSLSDMTRVVIDNTDSIAKNSDKLKKWADDLIGAEGTYSKLDDLVNKHLISGKSGVFTGNSEYAKAQQAYNAIAADNLRIQEATAVIQAKQAPILADLADKQAAYLEKVEAMKPAQQLAALGFMDDAESAKAMQLQSMAAAAAMGELGSKGEASTTKIIQGAAEADPALAAMLASMGLISQGADGTITVNFPAGQSVQDAINGLQSSINNLVEFEYLLHVGADTSDFWDHIHGLDGAHVGSVWVDVLAAYSAPLLPYQDPNYGLYGGRLGGVVPGYASGGTIARLAEAGPEILDFPNGGRGVAPTDGVYSVPVGTFVHTAPASKAMGLGATRTYIHNGPIYLQPMSGEDARAAYNRALMRERG